MIKGKKRLLLLLKLAPLPIFLTFYHTSVVQHLQKVCLYFYMYCLCIVNHFMRYLCTVGGVLMKLDPRKVPECSFHWSVMSQLSTHYKMYVVYMQLDMFICFQQFCHVRMGIFHVNLYSGQIWITHLKVRSLKLCLCDLNFKFIIFLQHGFLYDTFQQ